MPSKRILVTGGTGFIGRAVVSALVGRGDEVTVLSRNPRGAAAALPPAVRTVAYAPGRGGEWEAELTRADAVVNLAGEPIGGVRWTGEKKRELDASRAGATRALVAAIARAPGSARPAVLISASAVGFYGARGADESLDETSTPGTDFLAGLTGRWEAAALEARALGVRVVTPRIGIVLGAGGGALAKMLPAFRMFAGGPIGSGKQVMSWVHLADAARLLLLALDDDALSGPMNVTAPNPVTMDELARAIGQVLGRPSFLRVPEVAVRAMFGEGAEPLLTGQRVLPRVALARGYRFEFPEIVGAVRDAASGRGGR